MILVVVTVVVVFVGVAILNGSMPASAPDFRAAVHDGVVRENNFSVMCPPPIPVAHVAPHATFATLLDSVFESCRGECGEFEEAWRASITAFVRPLALSGKLFSASGFLSEMKRLGYRVAREGRGGVDTRRVPIIVRSGQVYVLPPTGALATNLSKSEWLWGPTAGMVQMLVIASATHRLADLYFLVDSFDWPHAPRGSPHPIVPVLTANSGDNHWDFPMPNFQFSYSDYNTLLSEPGPSGPPWDKRTPSAVWRGGAACNNQQSCESKCPRIVARLSANQTINVRDLDIRFAGIGYHESECLRRLLGDLIAADADSTATRMTREQMSHYRFVISMDGHSYASNLKYNLISGSTVLRQRTNFLEFFDPALAPWVHYVPFSCNTVADCELGLLVRWARGRSPPLDANLIWDSIAPSDLRAIAAAGDKFARSHLGQRGRSCYIHVLLRTLSAFFNTTDSILPADFVGASVLASDIFTLQAQEEEDKKIKWNKIAVSPTPVSYAPPTVTSSFSPAAAAAAASNKTKT